MFSNLGVRMRMFISVSVVVVMYAATFLAVGISLSHLTQYAKQGDEITLPRIILADEMILSRMEIQQYLTVVAASHDRDGYNKAEVAAKRFRDDVGKYTQLLRQNNDEQNLKQIEVIEAGFARFYASGKAMADAYLNRSVEAGNQLMDASGTAEFFKLGESIANQLAMFREQQITEAHNNSARFAGKAQSTYSMMIIGGLVASLSAAFFALWITRNVLGKMGGEPAYAAEVVKGVAEGDLAIEVIVNTNDNSSMLFAVKDMINKLSVIVANIRNATESITIASQEITSGNTDLSQRTEEQASSLEETSSSMEELLTNVRQNAESARHAYQLAQGSCDIAEQSGAAVEKLVATMTTINESSKKIEDIISVIDGIAFQTNILALNAAVEAARAGEQGRGFAVVAAEVRNLAQRSASAAKEIKLLIGGSMKNVSVGSSQVKDAADTISDVVTSVQLVASLMKDISATTTEQSTSIEQVNTAIVQMDEVTQQNAALVEESAAAAESMQEQAEDLLREVSAFKLEAAGTLSRDAAQSEAKHGASHFRLQRASPASPMTTQKLAKSKHDKDGDWKEF